MVERFELGAKPWNASDDIQFVLATDYEALEARLAESERLLEQYRANANVTSGEREKLLGEMAEAEKRWADAESKLASCDSDLAVFQGRLAEAERDIHAYRGALGYPVPSGFGELLSDGTRPECGLCRALAVVFSADSPPNSGEKPSV